MRVLVTGANGFVGSAVMKRFLAEEFQVRGTVRHDVADGSAELDIVNVGDLSATTDWATALRGVDIVVHTAGRAHVLSETAADSLDEFRRVNVEGTVNLARQAVEAGVSRFVFLSSIKVNGERTVAGRPYRAEDSPLPADAYGISKKEAEIALLQLARTSCLQVVIIRSVVVYGPGAKANILSMLRWLDRGIPLPLGAISNKRSLVALDNLVDLILTCTRHPAANNEIFLVSDGESVSTTELLRRAARALGKRPILIPIPPWLLRLAGRVVGRGAMVQRLCDSLEVDIGKTNRLLAWVPPVSMDDALRETARAYHQRFGAANPT